MTWQQVIAALGLVGLAIYQISQKQYNLAIQYFLAALAIFGIGKALTMASNERHKAWQLIIDNQSHFLMNTEILETNQKIIIDNAKTLQNNQEKLKQLQEIIAFKGGWIKPNLPGVENNHLKN